MADPIRPTNVRPSGPQRFAALDQDQRDRLRAEIRSRGLESDPRTIGLWRDGSTAPLSSTQRQMLLLQEVDPGSCAYNTFSSIRLSGAVETAAMLLALRLLVRRHEILRTTYRTDTNTPYQVVGEGDPPVRAVDLGGLTPDLAEAALEVLLRQIKQRPFDLKTEWPVQAVIVELPSDQTVLALCIHHIAFDGWSEHLLWNDLSVLYRHGPDGEALLPDLPFQYADYAAWQAEWLSRPESLDRRVRQWRELMSGAPSSTPIGRFDSLDQTSESGQSHPVDFGRQLLEDVERLARESTSTPYMVIVAAVQMFLAVWSGRSDVVLGSPNANRQGEGVRGLIGNFVNPQLFRCTVTAEASLVDVLSDVRRQALDLIDNNIPHDILIKELNPLRSSGGQPLYNVNFTLHTTPQVEAEIPGLTADDVAVPTQASRFDLDINLWQTADGLSGTVLHRTGVLLPAEGERFRDEFVRFVRSAVSKPSASVTEVADQAAVRPESRSAPADWRSRWEQVAITRAAHPAVRHSDGTEISYAELQGAVTELAGRLREAGAKPGTRILLKAGRDLSSLVAMLAVLSIDACYTPTDPGDPIGRADLIEQILEPDLVVVAGRVDDRKAPLDASSYDISCAPALADGRAPESPGHRDAAYILFTSGSTGVPKGVVVSRGSLLNYAEWAALEYRLAEGSGVPLVTSLGVDLTLTSIFATLLAGQTILTFPPEEHPGQRVLDCLRERSDLSMVKLTPSHLAMLPSSFQLGTVARTVVLGGEQLLLDTVREQLLDPRLRVYNEYGPTEATVACVAARLTSSATGESAPIGVPIAGALISIGDQAGRPVRPGELGELMVSGPGVALGYWRSPAATAKAFVPDPEDPARRCYLTGDLAYLDPATGQFYFKGRRDQQISLRGHRLELGEVEAAAGTVPGVRKAAATVSDGELVVAVTREPAAVPEAEQLDAWAATFDHTYEFDEQTGRDPYAGWISSLSREPIPAEEMADWADTTADRLGTLRPRRILEIGCGTGLLLSRLVEGCERYDAVDISAAALAHIDDLLRQPQYLPHRSKVSTALGDASKLPMATYDLVILNSVVQYFPSRAYLETTLSQAIARIGDHGCVFVGDVRAPERDLDLARAVLRQQFPELAAAELTQRALERVAEDPELRVSPDFFVRLARTADRPAAAFTCPKLPAIPNELSSYRYDAILELGERPGGNAAAIMPEPIEDLADLRRLLTADDPSAVVATVADIPLRQVHGLAVQSGWDAQVQFVSAADWDRCEVVLTPAAGRTGGLLLRDLDDGRRLATELVAEPRLLCGDEALVSQVRDAVAARIGPWARPASVLVGSRPQFAASGKSEPARFDPAPAPASGGRGFEGPHGAAVRDICQELLGRPVAATDNFFDIGGHSLLTFRLVQRLREVFGDAVAMRAPFTYPVLGELAAHLSAEHPASTGAATESAVPAVPLEEAPLSVDQRGMWFAQELDPDSAGLNIPIHVELAGELQVPALAAAVDALIRRHPVLRLRVLVRDGQPYQIVDPPQSVTVIDLNGLPVDEGRAAAYSLAEAQLERPFRLDAEPPARASLLVGHETIVLLLTLHHIAFDGRTEQILTRDLQDLYVGYVQGRAPEPLPAGPTYLSFAAQQHQAALEGGLADDVQYWVDLLADAPSPVVLPESAATGAVPTRVRCSVTLSGDDLAGFRELCRRWSSTGFQVLLSALAVVAARHCEKHDLVIATDLGDRPAGAEDVSGFFVTQALLRVQVLDDDLAGSVKSVRQALLEAYDHRAAPFDLVLDGLRRRNRQLAARPFQLKVTYNRSELRSGFTWRPFGPQLSGTGEGLTLLCVDSPESVVIIGDFTAGVLAHSVVTSIIEDARDLLVRAGRSELSDGR